MNTFNKLLLILGFILLIGGFLILFGNFPHGGKELPNNMVINALVLGFWYAEPVIGLILCFTGQAKTIKYTGVFFFLASICAWLIYAFSK
ncbi:MAG: hypothetical protein P4L51_23730 [Puia sp.]|nr:hypothetical protein [Puia sp.]